MATPGDFATALQSAEAQALQQGQLTALTGLYKSELAKLKARLANPAATDFERFQTANQIAQVQATVAALNMKAAEWAKGAVPSFYRRGLGVAQHALATVGKQRINFDMGAVIHMGAVEVLVQETTVDLLAANGKLETAYNAMIRKTQQGLLSERVINQKVAEGLIEGQTLTALKKGLAAEFEAVTSNGFIQAGQKTFAIADYAELVAQTRAREATTQGTLNAAAEYGMDLVQIDIHDQACPLCRRFSGRVYSVSGGHKDFPKLERRPPYHPRCECTLTVTSEDFLRDLGYYDQLVALSKNPDATFDNADDYKAMLGEPKNPMGGEAADIPPPPPTKGKSKKAAEAVAAIDATEAAKAAAHEEMVSAGLATPLTPQAAAQAAAEAAQRSAAVVKHIEKVEAAPDLFFPNNLDGPEMGTALALTNTSPEAWSSMKLLTIPGNTKGGSLGTDILSVINKAPVEKPGVVYASLRGVDQTKMELFKSAKKGGTFTFAQPQLATSQQNKAVLNSLSNTGGPNGGGVLFRIVTRGKGTVKSLSALPEPGPMDKIVVPGAKYRIVKKKTAKQTAADGQKFEQVIIDLEEMDESAEVITSANLAAANTEAAAAKAAKDSAQAAFDAAEAQAKAAAAKLEAAKAKEAAKLAKAAKAAEKKANVDAALKSKSKKIKSKLTPPKALGEMTQAEWDSWAAGLPDYVKASGEYDQLAIQFGAAKKVAGDVYDAALWGKALEEVPGQRLGGSTGAKLYVDKSTGKKWVIKTYDQQAAGMPTEQVQVEYLANSFYRAAGIEVPQSRLVRMPDGKLGHASEYLTPSQGEIFQEVGGVLRHASPDFKKQAIEKAQEGFAMDALLANWDAVGMSGDNMMAVFKGSEITNVLRIDNGGSLIFRAQGGLKGDKFGAKVHELNTLRGKSGASLSPATKAIYGEMTDDDVEKSIRALLDKITAKDIDNLVEAAFGPELTSVKSEIATTLKARLDYMAKWSDERKKLLDVKEAARRASSGLGKGNNTPGTRRTVRRQNVEHVVDDMEKTGLEYYEREKGRLGLEPATSDLPCFNTDFESINDPRLAVNKFTGGAYHDINRIARGDDIENTVHTKTIKDMDAFFASEDNIGYEGWTFRGITVDEDEYAEKLERWASGEWGVYWNKTFQSSAAKPDGAFGGNFEVAFLNKGIQGAFVRPISRHPGEWEVLMPRNNTWRVIGWDRTDGRGGPKFKIVVEETDEAIPDSQAPVPRIDFEKFQRAVINNIGDGKPTSSINVNSYRRQT